MKSSFIFVIARVAAMSMVLAACATGGPAGTAGGNHPWDRATQTLNETEADVLRGGLRSVAKHAGDLEQVLNGANRSVLSTKVGDITYILVDGRAEALFGSVQASIIASGDKTGGNVKSTVLVANPYPLIAMVLGSYYNEIGRSADAMRVLDLGLNLYLIENEKLGVTMPSLISERGVALMALKRFPEALAGYESGLAIKDLNPMDHGRLLRGRCSVLIDLKRLDDAAKSCSESLTFSPNNPLALSELVYIGQLRSGAPERPAAMTTPLLP